MYWTPVLNTFSHPIQRIVSACYLPLFAITENQKILISYNSEVAVVKGKLLFLVELELRNEVPSIELPT
jgi:hypothetical protein